MPQARDFLGAAGSVGTWVAQVLHPQGVAAHLGVVVHAKVADLVLESGPVAPLAQQQQPVVAQAVFLVGAGPARQKSRDVRCRRVRQAQAHVPVGGPGFEHMTAHLRQQGLQAAAVAPVKGLSNIEHGLIGRRERRGRACKGDRCADASPQGNPHQHTRHEVR